MRIGGAAGWVIEIMIDRVRLENSKCRCLRLRLTSEGAEYLCGIVTFGLNFGR